MVVVGESYYRTMRRVFADLYRQNKVIERKEIVYRSTILQTNISQDKLEKKTIKKKRYFVRYFVDTKNDTFIIGTNTLETIF